MATNLSHQSRRALHRDWSPAKSLSTKTVILSTCFCLRYLSTPDTALHVSTGQNRIHEARSFSWPNVALFQQDSICLGPGMKVSFGFENTVCVFESIVIQQTLKVVALHCRSHIMIWIPSSHLDQDCGTMLHCVCLFGSLLTLHRLGSHNQVARCGKRLGFRTCS